ncbi:MAG TPA: ACT domain-containing protein [Candidatus Limosilactobacillus excrementigallinarum]|nr:ACT domain-containing protein [Candidatus Limosilactobacillus excrementigallinarum]
MKAILTVLGEDQVGIIAQISTVLADKNINILDVSQTIMDGNFVMMMSVQVPEALDGHHLNTEFTKLGKQIGVEINLRNAKLYDAMHNL